MTVLSVSSARGVQVISVLMLSSAGVSIAMEQAVGQSVSGDSSLSLEQLQRSDVLAAVREHLNQHITEESALDVTRSAGEQRAPFYRNLSDELKDAAPLVLTTLTQDDHSEKETAIIGAGVQLLFYVLQEDFLDIFHVAIEKNGTPSRPFFTALAVLGVGANKRLLMGTQDGQVRLFGRNVYPLVGEVAGAVTEIVPHVSGKKVAARFCTADGKSYAAIACQMPAVGNGCAQGNSEPSHAWSTLACLVGQNSNPLASQELSPALSVSEAEDGALGDWQKGRSNVTGISFDDAGLLHTKLSSGEEEVWNARITKRGTLKIDCVQEAR